MSGNELSEADGPMWNCERDRFGIGKANRALRVINDFVKKSSTMYGIRIISVSRVFAICHCITLPEFPLRDFGRPLRDYLLGKAPLLPATTVIVIVNSDKVSRDGRFFPLCPNVEANCLNSGFQRGVRSFG